MIIDREGSVFEADQKVTVPSFGSGELVKVHRRDGVVSSRAREGGGPGGFSRCGGACSSGAGFDPVKKAKAQNPLNSIGDEKWQICGD